MKANLRSVNKDFQMGMFPGLVSSLKGEEAPRLSATVAISVKDKVTGESFKRTIAFDCREVDHLIKWLEQLLTHKRVKADIESFANGRDG